MFSSRFVSVVEGSRFVSVVEGSRFVSVVEGSRFVSVVEGSSVSPAQYTQTQQTAINTQDMEYLVS